MARIYKAHIDHDAVEGIEVAPPKREGRWFWGALFAALLTLGAITGYSLSAGSSAVQLAQTDRTSETATN